MIWEDWLSHAASALNMTVSQTAMFLSFIITAMMIVTVLIASKGRAAEITTPVTALLMIILFSFMGWLPIWTGSVIALILSLFIAMKISRVVD